MKDSIELKDQQTIVFIGDSITDAEKHRRSYEPFGLGYVHFVANWLFAKYPHLNLRIINSGTSGDTILDLQQRWQQDCIDHQPDILSVLVGVNDAWRLYAEHCQQKDVSEPKQYEVTYSRLISQVKQQCKSKIVLMQPFMFGDNEQEYVFKALRRYIEIVNDLVNRFDAILVPLQSQIDKQIKDVPWQKWSTDMVHPYTWAHAWIAQQWLQATGL